MEASALILAAGAGTRMKSSKPKVAHQIFGKPLVRWVVDAAHAAGIDSVVGVVGHGREQVEPLLTDVTTVVQEEQLGTAHAVLAARGALEGRSGSLVVLTGDSPLVRAETIAELVRTREEANAAVVVLTMEAENPTGYGRIIRDAAGDVQEIVEQKDCTPEQAAVTECNSGFYCFDIETLFAALEEVSTDNAQGEYYITDIIALAYQEGREIVAVHPQRLSEVEGVNNRLQLSRLERVYQSEQAEKLLLAGVMLRDPARFDLRGTLTHGRDVEIDTNVIIEGNVTLGHRVKIGAGCVIKNSVIGDDCEISPYTVVEDANLAAACTIGPFARLRPGAELLEGAHVGNFVEMKKARLGKGSKAGHLTYLGDAEIGDNVNIGAGTITCNYDGANKFKTIIGDDVFVGSDTQLVAPVTVGKGATIAAGTTVTRNVGENALAISRVPQTQKEGWRRPVKKK